MANVILIKNSLTPTAVPTGLQQGEIAINVANGQMWFGDGTPTAKLLNQNIWINPIATPPPVYLENEGAFWLQTDVQALRIYQGGQWKLSGMPITGGEFTGHINVRNSINDRNVLQTTDGGIIIDGEFTQGKNTEEGEPFTTFGYNDIRTPVGGILMWPAEDLPSDKWLFCRGQELNKGAYAELYATLTSGLSAECIYGETASDFNLPDYRGVFLRGFNDSKVSDGGGLDLGEMFDEHAVDRFNRGDGVEGDQVGTLQFDAFERHDHKVGGFPAGDLGGNGNLVANYPSAQNRDSGETGTIFSSTGSPVDALETVPKNISVNHIIRVF